jgi:dTDP-4-amino-4,6-dideoxygalactose transaminase
MHTYEPVSEFERRVSEYAGAPYGVAVNSCTNAILLSVKYAFMQGGCDGRVWLPKHTYVGVAYAVLAAGGTCRFRDVDWRGAYELHLHRTVDSQRIRIIDAARRFTTGMYRAGSLYCLSFHETKILPIGDGGMILTDSLEAAETLRRMRFDGRTPGRSVHEDTFDIPAYHCHMKPDVATRGLMLMAGVRTYNEDLPTDNYPDLSQFPIFQGEV